ncbi:MCE family protein [Saccharopolyspora cebuensis]|uniref:MCE family protein n=1 Tax=Saccharopolyspora cebuensis TaxID=418759 RepID=A0ABV4CN58_9PSEU
MTATRALLAAAVAGAALTTGGCGLSLHALDVGTSPGGPTKRITAVFTDAGRLPVGGVVRRGPQVVGRVAEVRARDFRAVVRLEVRADVRLPADTTARLELSSALGEEQVVLEAPAGASRRPPLADGAVLGVDRTSRGPAVEDTLAALGTMLNGAGIDQARTVVTELNDALAGREGQVRTLLGELRSVLVTLDDQRGRIIAALDSIHAASGRLAASRAAIGESAERLRPVVEGLVAERDRFGALLAGTAELSGAADRLVAASADSVARQVEALRPVLADLRTFEGTLGETLTGLQEFARLFQQATPGDYVLFNGTVDVPGSIAELFAPGSPTPVPPDNPLGRVLGGGA